MNLIKSKKGQLFALEAKDFAIGFLFGAGITIIVFVVLVKLGKIPFEWLEFLRPKI